MCGISGIFLLDGAGVADLELIHRMRAVAVHRGPDDHGVLRDGPVGLGFNRLSIIDLAGGHQPMANADESAWIVFNGEIYNFLELREELERAGHQFRTRSDTEVILQGWEAFGEEVVHKLRGMFAFAIWDRRRRMLFCARDRLGIKPFYYHHTEGRLLAFASELKSLLEVPQIPREVDPIALEEFLRHRYVIAPRTMLRGVLKLPPGHTLSATTRGVRIDRYWELPLDQAPEPRPEAAILEEFDTLFRETVRRHLIADVPLGAFLSGGLDSSAVVAMMARCGVAKIKTFSIGYKAPESELPFAAIVARRFETEHHPLELTPEDFRDLFPKIVWYMDEPVGDEASLPLYYLARFARRHVTVALSGEGSDEIFAGYPIYRTMLFYQGFEQFPLARAAGRVLGRWIPHRKLRKYAGMLGSPLEERYDGVSRVLSFDEIRGIRNGAELRGERETIRAIYRQTAALSPLRRMCGLDLKTWLADDLLVKADRMSMASSLELRVPFLDHQLVEFVFRLPDDMKIRGRRMKYLLKRYLADRLPREVLDRPKMGFPVPTKAWFRGDLAAMARENLLAPNGPVREFLSGPVVERLLDRHARSDLSGPIYALLVFDQWLRNLKTRPDFTHAG